MKYEIGQDVNVELIAKVKGISLDTHGELQYQVEGYQGQMGWVRENNIYPLPQEDNA